MKNKVFVFLMCLFFSCDLPEKKIKQPNVIFILVDDLGWKDLGYSGSEFYETPNLDKFSKESFEFTSAYAASSVCSPTRASIMTGKHPARVNITDWIPGVDPKNRPLLGPEDLHQLPLIETTFAEKLKDIGYKTFYAGKWHLGSEGYYPEQNGFDINIGGFEKGSPMGGYYSPYKNPKLNDGPEGEYLTNRLTDESISFLENHNKEQPFLLFLSFYNVHTPIQPNLDHVDYYKNKLLNGTNNKVITRKEGEAQTVLNQVNYNYASMVHAMDENVGKLIESLKKNDLYENSLIIFSSDNGGLSTQRRVAPTSVVPLRAGKGYLYEGGIRIPQLIKTPGQTINKKINQVTVSYDLFPTITDYVGIKNNNLIDGKSLMPVFENQNKLDRSEVFWHFPHYHGSMWKPGSAVRVGNYKLIHFYESNQSELYNLKEDAGEKNDLSLIYPEKTKELLNRLIILKEEMNANSVKINPNFKSKKDQIK